MVSTLIGKIFMMKSNTMCRCEETPPFGVDEAIPFFASKEIASLSSLSGSSLATTRNVRIQ